MNMELRERLITLLIDSLKYSPEEAIAGADKLENFILDLVESD